MLTRWASCRAATPTPTPSTPTVAPAITFNGAQGSGFGTGYGSDISTLPQASATPYGSACDVAPTVHFSCYPGEDISPTDTIVVFARHVDPAGINYVEFQLEGGTAQQVNWQIKHPSKNVFGFPIKLSVDGPAILKARVVPFNGLEVVGYVFVRGIKSGIPADDVTIYIDPVNGNDSWTGLSKTFTSGTAGPKKTLQGAMSFSGGLVGHWSDAGEPSSIEGAYLVIQRQYSIVVVGSSNQYLDYSASSSATGWAGNYIARNKKKLVVRQDTGITGTKLRRTSRDDMVLAATWIEFQGIPFETDNVTTCFFPSNGLSDLTNPLRAFSHAFVAGSHVKHSQGALGPISHGYPQGIPAGEIYKTQFFQPQAPFVVAESDFDHQNFAGAFFTRGVRGYFAQFFEQLNTIYQSGATKIDVRLTQKGQSETRYHNEYDLVVSSVTPNSPVAGQTTIAFSGSPTLVDSTSGSWLANEIYGRFLTGAAVGQGGKNQGAGLVYTDQAGNTYSYPPNKDGTTAFDTVGFRLVSSNNTTKQVVITGLPTGVVAGDIFRFYLVGHPDVLEIIGVDTSIETTGQINNIGWQNVMVVGPTITAPFLVQTYTSTGATIGQSVTVSTAGKTITSYSGPIRSGDFIRNTSTGEYRQVKTASGGTGTLYDAFSSDLSNQVCSMSRGANRFNFTNFICHKTSVDYTPGDWQYGGSEFIMGPMSLLGYRPGNVGLINFATDLGRTSATNPCFGQRNVLFEGSIVSGITNGGSGTIDTTYGFKSPDSSYHQSYGSKVGGAAADGVPSFPANYTSYLPTSGVSIKASAAVVLQCPWDIDGNVRTTASIVGAKVA